MATEVSYESTQYKLRAGSPMPVAGPTGTFVLHTFMAEISVVDNYVCTESLPGSDEFRGQGGDFMQASFNRLQDVGGNVFQGKVVHSPTYENESVLNFNF